MKSLEDYKNKAWEDLNCNSPEMQDGIEAALEWSYNQLRKGQTLPLDSVSQQRELLIDFLTWYIHKSDMRGAGFSIELIAKEYLKSINCG